MTAYIARRLLTAIPLLIAISIVCFAVIQLPPGDFASKYKQDLIDRGGMSEHEAQEQVGGADFSSISLVNVYDSIRAPVPVCVIRVGFIEQAVLEIACR